LRSIAAKREERLTNFNEIKFEEQGLGRGRDGNGQRRKMGLFTWRTPRTIKENTRRSRTQRKASICYYNDSYPNPRANSFQLCHLWERATLVLILRDTTAAISTTGWMTRPPNLTFYVLRSAKSVYVKLRFFCPRRAKERPFKRSRSHPITPHLLHSFFRYSSCKQFRLKKAFSPKAKQGKQGARPRVRLKALTAIGWSRSISGDYHRDITTGDFHGNELRFRRLVMRGM
jgi:hypothetical protein